MEEVWHRRALALFAVLVYMVICGFAYQITASGDVTGDFPGPLTVAKLQGRTLSSAAPSAGNAVLWNGSQWGPGSVDYTTLTNKPTNISAFTNDLGYLTSIGGQQYNIMVGGSTATALVAKTVDVALLNVAAEINVYKVNCATDAGSLSVRVFHPGGDLVSGLSCSTDGGSSSVISNHIVVSDRRIGYEISGVSGSPTTLAIAIQYTR